MGRIKSTAIKRASKALLTRESFTTDFEENKKILDVYNLPDKGTRNKIAGYLVRLRIAENLIKKPTNTT